MAEDKFLVKALLELTDPGRYKTLWYGVRNNSLTYEDNYQKTLTEPFNLLRHYRPPVTHTKPWGGGGRQLGTNVKFS